MFPVTALSLSDQFLQFKKLRGVVTPPSAVRSHVCVVKVGQGQGAHSSFTAVAELG